MNKSRPVKVHSDWICSTRVRMRRNDPWGENRSDTDWGSLGMKNTSVFTSAWNCYSNECNTLVSMNLYIMNDSSTLLRTGVVVTSSLRPFLCQQNAIKFPVNVMAMTQTAGVRLHGAQGNIFGKKKKVTNDQLECCQRGTAHYQCDVM